eukprot:scaffold23153_cov135-Isochrysis_galbana.AAC.1
MEPCYCKLVLSDPRDPRGGEVVCSLLQWSLPLQSTLLSLSAVCVEVLRHCSPSHSGAQLSADLRLLPINKGCVVSAVSCKALAGFASVCGQKFCRHKSQTGSQASLERLARGLGSPCCPTLGRADVSAPICLSGPCRSARRPRKRGARQRAPPPC